jgi:hypothetical protein
MGKISSKQRYMQLMEWLPTLKTQRGKHVKQQQSRMDYMQQRRNG